ncbi:TetR/AcrR family transcriptional regulator [Sphingomonas koreensis]|jgi:AcrR family transcriptional regulator|uniref:TetR family transcriptional regulator n=1 Tax=Sphingomonas koreensis TaxID=93064 RepID=A0A1L6JE66_9SPHN|nr:TetR/AcrR family transcriptional regulator [Sphingomonas koreensis]APR54195.1 TetR family transcriptional regulator [Sphingomonas koreensis]MDC7809192.1 TetR/AcrR family transcriptional regulator [Sphingomonas koreensis]PJI90229.1 TetR family transcriptional regulator [Sphingomonas koreensis]RSU17279.1 TetR/AcrR family transcriptional regulator [Sphingomonas koreensis]RSU21770.1 TetR/AcrR family transcriptional regulator [Sphingomonas koreensis]
MNRNYKQARPAQKRRKRLGSEVREEGLAAARKLLLAGGPAAVTLASVGAEIGMSHANVLHHFGSAAGLQSALMGSMINDLTGALDDVVTHLKTDAAAPRSIADRVFDAFDKGGAGALAAWIVLSGEVEHLEPVREAVRELVAAIAAQSDDPGTEERVRGAVLMMAVCAFGDAVIGPHVRDMLGEPDDSMRALVARMLPMFLVPPA